MFNTSTVLIGPSNIDGYVFVLEYLVLGALLQVSRPSSVNLRDVILATIDIQHGHPYTLTSPQVEMLQTK